MKIKPRTILISGIKIVALLILATGMLITSSFGGEYPTKPITFIVPFAAGGSNDIAYRVLADYFSKKWGKQINIVNQPGGNTIPATLEVYQSPPDGYTLFADSIHSASVQYATIKNLPFKLEDRTFVAMVSYFPYACATSLNKPWKTLKDVAEFVKKEPSNFIWGALGTAGLSQWGVYQLSEILSVDPRDTRRVVYAGAPQILTALAGGFVDFYYCGVATALPFYQAGKIRMLAITAPNRNKTVPDVPTTKESGFPGLELMAWLGITGPPKLHPEVIEKWKEGMRRASNDPEFISKLEKVGNSVNYLPPDKFREMVLTEAESFKISFKKYE